jgi:hypothetical protein
VDRWFVRSLLIGSPTPSRPRYLSGLFFTSRVFFAMMMNSAGLLKTKIGSEGVQACIYTYIYVYICMYICINICICMYVCMYCIRTCDGLLNDGKR